MIKTIVHEKELRDVNQMRRHKRYAVDCGEMCGKIMLAKYVKILNISIGGIAFQTDKRLRIGGLYTLTLAGKTRDFVIQGTVAWSSLRECIKDSGDNVIPIYTTGMKFLNVTTNILDELNSYIADHHQNRDKASVFSSVGLAI